MTVPAYECGGSWTNDCGCGRDHNYCWPEPDVRCCPRLQTTPETPADEVAFIERIKRMSVEILHLASGKQFGLCRRVVRPCRENCHGKPLLTSYGVAGLAPYLDGGRWFNSPCNACGPSGCSCSEICEVDLPGPVESIDQVRLDGEILPSWMYRVDNNRKLVRTKQYVTKTGPVSFVYTVNGQPGSTLCDISPAPDAVTGASGPVAGCYTPTQNNPEFHWNNLDTAQVTLNGTDPNAEYITSFFEGDYPAGITGTYLWPSGLTVNAGETTVSDVTANGTVMKITVVTGSMTRYDVTPYGWILKPGTTIRMERVGPVAGGCWPTCQEMSLDPTEPGTFEVAYRIGTPVPEMGTWVAGLLACELIKACGPDEVACALPKNVRSVVRESVSVEFGDFRLGGDGNLSFGETGIPEVDLWLRTVNPYKATGRARVYSPDKPRPRSTTWPCND